jgi:membrane protein YdbS with pleckstrin-like domain
VPISQKLLTDGESVVVDTRTHPKALIFPVLILLVTLAVAIFLDRLIDNHVISLIVWILAAVVIVWFTLRPFLNWLTSTYTVTTKRLITREGVLARRGHDIPLMRISDVAYDMGIIDRMLGCGTLVISDASTHGSVRLHDIPHVESVQRKLTELLASGSAGETRSSDGS